MADEKVNIEDMMVSMREQKSVEERQVKGLIALLYRIARDLEAGIAIEMDFDVSVDESKNYSIIEINKLKTYHKRKK